MLRATGCERKFSTGSKQPVHTFSLVICKKYKESSACSVALMHQLMVQPQVGAGWCGVAWAAPPVPVPVLPVSTGPASSGATELPALQLPATFTLPLAWLNELCLLLLPPVCSERNSVCSSETTWQQKPAAGAWQAMFIDVAAGGW